MKRLDTAAQDTAVLAKRARHRTWPWCRLKNDFFDDPLWRVVADMTGLPLFQVQAFVGRLESLANKSTPRGFVGDFRPAEFGAATGMPTEHAARIYAALEHSDIGWVDQEHVATFYPRNPDKVDETAAERDQRRKARKWIRKELDRRVQAGSITAEQREDVAGALLDLLGDEELFALRKKLAAGVALEAALSTGHGEPRRGSVVATPRAEQTKSERAFVDNSGDGTRRTEEGPSEEGVAGPASDPQAQAAQWIAIEGRRIAIARMPAENPGKVDMLIERWLAQDLDGNAGALMTVLIECDRLNLVGSMFHVEVTRRCDQHRKREALQQEAPRLPLGGIQPVKKSGAA